MVLMLIAAITEKTVTYDVRSSYGNNAVGVVVCDAHTVFCAYD